MIKKLYLFLGLLCSSCDANQIVNTKASMVEVSDKPISQKQPDNKKYKFENVEYQTVLNHPDKNIRVYCQHLKTRSLCFFEAFIDNRYVKYDISGVENTNLFRATDTPSKIEVARTYPVKWINVDNDSATIDMKTELYRSDKKWTTSTLLLINFDTGIVDR